jgi:glucose-6-phosphate 1-dehydrogenase
MNRPTDPGPTVFVLFGATGDLSRRMVLPAFFTLAAQGLLPAQWRLIGNGRGDVSHLDFRAHVRSALEEFGPHPDEGPWDEFEQRLLFAGGGFDQSDSGSLLDVISHAEEELGERARLVHYLAVPPGAFAEITRALGRHGLVDNARVVYEKPFGTSPENFRELDDVVHSVLDESQVYRIDHFLGKEATQQLHVVRFANGLFEAMWNGEHVRAVQIDVPEELDVADRAAFYERTGATLDMLVTHLVQVAAEIAMEPPASLDADDLQTARESIIARFRPLDPNEVVLGQFDGYREIDGVDPSSSVDTFVAARLWIDDDRWRDVPFLLRTGKRLAASRQRISLILREPKGPLDQVPMHGNVLAFDLGGSGELELRLMAKQPGATMTLEPADVTIPLAGLPHADPLPPYARLIHDVLLGDRSLFTRPDGLAAVWRLAEPLLDNRPEPLPYAPGSWGPERADELAAPDGWLLGGG